MVGDGWRLNTGEKTNHNVEVEKEIIFTVSNPKYKLNDLIIEEKVYDEIQTIVNAERCWKTVFDV